MRMPSHTQEENVSSMTVAGVLDNAVEVLQMLQLLQEVVPS
jgi:hypothetical protein